MLSLEKIKELVRDGESETVEFKKSTAEQEKACHTICAMANGNGGYVIFGISPQGKILGQDIGSQTLERLAQDLKNFEPPIFPEINCIKLGHGKELIVVEITRSSRMPCVFRGNAYKRITNTTSIMPRAEYQRLIIEEMHAQERWENTVASGWTPAMLDENEIILTLEEAIRRGRMADPQTRNIKEILRGLGLLNRQEEILRAAVVLFAREENILPDFPQLKLRVAKFKGNDKTEFLDNKQFFGNAFDLLRKAEKFLIENLPIAGKIIPGVIERVDSPLYPLEALREALANAFCHRDYALGGGSVAVAIYDSHLEITSSGSLHFGLLVDDLYKPHESLPWNPLIAHVFYRRGIIESWGRGIFKIAELMQNAGLGLPQFKTTSGAVSIVFNKNYDLEPRHVGHNLSSRQNNILNILGSATTPFLQLNEIVKLCEADKRVVRADLQFLSQLGLVKVEGHAKGAKWRLIRVVK